MGHLKDITAPDTVEVSIRFDGKVLWVNVDGRCELRICRIGRLVLDDERRQVNEHNKSDREMDLLDTLKLAVQVMRDHDVDVSLSGEFEIFVDAIEQAGGS